MIVPMKNSHNQARTAFITGGSGFIGSELIRQLNAQEIRVKALMRKTSTDKNTKGLEYETIQGDLQNLDALKKGVMGVDYVFHLAGAIWAKSREEYFIHNCEGTKNLANACKDVNPGLKRFVFVSSLSASGPASDLTAKSETDYDTPVSWYGESKLAAERELLRIADGVYPVSIVRPPAVYGPRDQDVFTFFKYVFGGVVPLFPTTNSTQQKYYSLVHVEDLVNGIILSATVTEQAKRDVFFLCGDQFHTLKEIYSEIAIALSKRPTYISVPKFVMSIMARIYGWLQSITGKRMPLNQDKLQELLPDFWICSNKHAKQKLGFQPKYNLTKGIHMTAEWYLKEGWLGKRRF